MIRLRSLPRCIAFICLALTSACRYSGSSPVRERPALAVLMVVDQLRPDLLENYDTLYSGGFRRLLDDGYRFANATHDHAITHTAPGHVTLSTGVYPARHGVIANSWAEREVDRWRSVYSVEDLDRAILGHTELPGRGPANIERPGLPDWILAHDSTSRIVSVSRKDRAAIGLAAEATGDVYWLADLGGEFITSDAYRSEIPSWVSGFNRTSMPRIYADTVWESTVPAEARALTRPDTSAYELDGQHTAFPHRAHDVVDTSDPQALNHWRFEYTPFPDRAVLELAQEAVRALDLGGRGSVDYLGVALSQTDLVGHHFGPRSREQLDNLLRLDRELGRFFSFLDETVGPGRWVLAFSADHGVLEVPEYLADRGVAARRLTRMDRSQLRQRMQDAIAAASGADDDVATERAIQQAVTTLPFVAAAYTFDEIERGEAVDSFAVLYAHSHSRTRIARFESRSGVYIRFRPNVLDWSVADPASHGSPYYYDRHVPLIFLGGTVPSGLSEERVATVDVAPTLASLVGITTPNDLDGRTLEQIVTR